MKLFAVVLHYFSSINDTGYSVIVVSCLLHPYFVTKQGSAAGLVIDAWLTGLLQVHISTALAYEYEDVLSRKLSDVRWQKLKPVLGTLLSCAQFTTIYYSWRPTSPDAGDDLVIDCAMNASAIVTTYNLRDFRKARFLGLQVMTPAELVIKLALEGG